MEDLAVPETVQALMAARIDTLRPELKALLHDAAVVGRIFWSGALAAIGERDRDEVRRDLNELVRREFVRPVRLSSVEGDDEFSFWHALVRDVAYQQIPRTPRAEKHVAVARLDRDDGGSGSRIRRRRSSTTTVRRSSSRGRLARSGRSSPPVCSAASCSQPTALTSWIQSGR